MKKTLLLGVAMLCTQLSFGQYITAYSPEYNYSSIMPSTACTLNDVGTDTRDVSGGSNYYANFLNVTVNSCPDATLGTPTFNWESSHATSGILALPADAIDPDVVLVSPNGSDEAWAIIVYYSQSNGGYCMSVSEFEMLGPWAFLTMSTPMLIQNYAPTNYPPHINIDADALGHYAVVMQMNGYILSKTQTHAGGPPIVPINPVATSGLMEPDIAYMGNANNEATIIAVTNMRDRYRTYTRSYGGAIYSPYTSPILPYLFQPRIAAPVAGGTNDYSITVGREYVVGPNTYNDILFQNNEGAITVANASYPGFAALNVNNRNSLPCLSYTYSGYMTGEQVSLGWYVASIGVNPMQPNTFIGVDISTASLLPNTTTYMDVSNYYGLNNESTLALSGRHTVWAKTAAFTYTSSASPFFAAQLVWKYEYSSAGHWKTTSTQNIAGKNAALSVYPNPATDQINIHVDQLGSSYNYEILNQVGQVVEKGTIQQNETPINIANWASGMYVIKMTNVASNELTTMKFIKN